MFEEPFRVEVRALGGQGAGVLGLVLAPSLAACAAPFRAVLQEARLANPVTYSIVCIDGAVAPKCDSPGTAIETACKLLKGGTNVRQIRGSDGFMMERRDIEIECLRRGEGKWEPPQRPTQRD